MCVQSELNYVCACVLMLDVCACVLVLEYVSLCSIGYVHVCSY